MPLEKEVQDDHFPDLPSDDTLSEEKINRDIDRLLKIPFYGAVFEKYNRFMDYMLEQHITTYKVLRFMEFPHS